MEQNPCAWNSTNVPGKRKMTGKGLRGEKEMENVI